MSAVSPLYQSIKQQTIVQPRALDFYMCSCGARGDMDDPIPIAAG